MDLLLKCLVIVVIFFILYMSFTTSRVKEGLTNASNATSSSTSNNPAPGLAGNASAYSSTISGKVVQLVDALLVRKYNTDYVNIINSMKNYVNALSLETILSVDASDLANNDIISTLEKLNTYNGAQTSLNNVLSYISSQAG